MSFYIPPPQQYLDELHDAGVPELFEPQMTARNRADAIRASKRKLNRVKQGLNKTKDQIIQRFSSKRGADDGSTSVKLRLAPYHLLSNLELELEKQIDTLERILASGKLLPEGFHFGEVIFGSEETGEWFLGDDEDRERWEHTMDVKSQLDEFMKQRAPLVSKQKAIKERAQRLQERVKKDSARLKRRNTSGFIGTILFVMLVIAVGGIGYGYTQINPADIPDNVVGSAPGLIMVAVGGLFLFSSPVVYASWRRQMNHLSDTIVSFKQEIASLKEDSRLLQRDYAPVNEKCKMLHEEYTELRATFGK